MYNVNVSFPLIDNATLCTLKLCKANGSWKENIVCEHCWVALSVDGIGYVCVQILTLQRALYVVVSKALTILVLLNKECLSTLTCKYGNNVSVLFITPSVLHYCWNLSYSYLWPVSIIYQTKTKFTSKPCMLTIFLLLIVGWLEFHTKLWIHTTTSSQLLLCPYFLSSIQFLRHMRDFFQVTYKIDCQEEQMDDISRQVVTLTCVGVGFSNFSKGMT